MIRDRSRRVLTVLALVACPLAVSRAAYAQGSRWEESWVGSETETYLRVLALTRTDGLAWIARPFSPVALERLAADTAGHPWRAHMRDVPHDGVTVLRASAAASYNSSLPWGFNDGAVWQGKGLNAWATAGGAWRRGIVSVRVEPLAFIAQNAGFPLLPVPASARSPFVDDARPLTIDIPQRFGDGVYARVDAGQSFIRLDARSLMVSVGTDNVGWGPSLRNPLLLGANAGGFPHVVLGTSSPLRTPVGTVQGQVLYGRLSQSAQAPDTRGDGTRLGSGVLASWSPAVAPALELGAYRFYHRDWPQRLGASVLGIPFGAVFYDPQVQTGDVADNQLAALYTRWSSKAAGTEVYGEYGKGDRNLNVRDLLVEPEHVSAWSLGILKSFGTPAAGHFWTIRSEVVNGRVTSLARIRFQGDFYDHTPITEGHTQRGQLLGSPLLERKGGFEIGVDRWSGDGRAGVQLTQRLLPPTLAEGSAADDSRAQWAVEMNRTRFRGTADLTWRAGVLVDLNRTRGHDVLSAFAGGSWRGHLAGTGA